MNEGALMNRNQGSCQWKIRIVGLVYSKVRRKRDKVIEGRGWKGGLSLFTLCLRDKSFCYVRTVEISCVRVQKQGLLF